MISTPLDLIRHALDRGWAGLRKPTTIYGPRIYQREYKRQKRASLYAAGLTATGAQRKNRRLGWKTSATYWRDWKRQRSAELHAAGLHSHPSLRLPTNVS